MSTMFAVDTPGFPRVVFAMFNACVTSGEKAGNESQQHRQLVTDKTQDV